MRVLIDQPGGTVGEKTILELDSGSEVAKRVEKCLSMLAWAVLEGALGPNEWARGKWLEIERITNLIETTTVPTKDEVAGDAGSGEQQEPEG